MIHYKMRLPALDGLRGIAILAVFVFHYAGSVQNRALSLVVGLGWSGVDLFFVLSGFLITGILYETQADPHYYRNFYARRALRIFPIYYLTVLLFWIWKPLGSQWHAGHLAWLVYLGYPAALIWPSLTQAPVALITHTWSLSVEEQFYGVWPWIIRRLRSAERIVAASLAIGLGALLLRLLLFWRGWPGEWMYSFLLCRMDSLALGAALAILLRTRPALLQRWTLPIGVMAACAVGLICWREGPDRNGPWMETIGYSLTSLAYGALLLVALNSSRISRILSASPLRMCGRYSYGLYLYHFPLRAFLAPLHAIFAHRLGTTLGGAVYVGICLLLNLAVAAISFHFLESPILKRKARYDSQSVRAVRGGAPVPVLSAAGRE